MQPTLRILPGTGLKSITAKSKETTAEPDAGVNEDSAALHPHDSASRSEK